MAIYQADTGMVHAARHCRDAATARHRARRRAARPDARPGWWPPVRAGVELRDPAGRVRCRRVVVTADAWTNDVLAGVGVQLPLTVTQEQVTYFAPDDPAAFAPGELPGMDLDGRAELLRLPVPSARRRVKAGQDVGGRVTSAAGRSSRPIRRTFASWPSSWPRRFPGSAGAVLRTVTCLYTLTPDRDFVVGALPGHPDIVVGLGAGHGFKFTPTFGRVLADLATDGHHRQRPDAVHGSTGRRCTDPSFPVSWLV